MRTYTRPHVAKQRHTRTENGQISNVYSINLIIGDRKMCELEKKILDAVKTETAGKVETRWYRAKARQLKSICAAIKSGAKVKRRALYFGRWQATTRRQHGGGCMRSVYPLQRVTVLRMLVQIVWTSGRGINFKTCDDMKRSIIEGGIWSACSVVVVVVVFGMILTDACDGFYMCRDIYENGGGVWVAFLASLVIVGFIYSVWFAWFVTGEILINADYIDGTK